MHILYNFQIEIFRQLNNQHGKISHNFRPTQPLYGRIIRMNVENSSVAITLHLYYLLFVFLAFLL